MSAHRLHKGRLTLWMSSFPQQLLCPLPQDANHAIRYWLNVQQANRHTAIVVKDECNRRPNRKLEISTAPTRAKSREPAYSQALNPETSPNYAHAVRLC